jgi:Trk-type K+ transport system membrane component
MDTGPGLFVIVVGCGRLGSYLADQLSVAGAQTPATVLWTQIVGMFLGRLELFVVIVSLLRIVRDLPTLVVGARP